MSVGGLIVLSLALGVGAWLAFLWSVKSGQYEDPEGPKYRMLDEDEDAPTPPAKPPLAHGPKSCNLHPREQTQDPPREEEGQPGA